MDIFVASTSEHKIGATRDAAKIAFHGKTLNIKGHKAASGINEQPIGNEETLQGAFNRLTNLKTVIGGTRYDLLVAMENGLFVVNMNGTDMWIDSGWVIAQDADGRQAIAQTAGVPFPTADVEIARAEGFATVTAGSVIARQPGVDGTNPHGYLTNSLVHRTETLKQAILAAMGQIQMQAKKQ